MSVANAPRVTASARHRTAFFALCAGNFMVLLDTSILNVALPDIQRDLHASAVLLPWSSVAYTVTFSCLLLAAGVVADRFGAPRMYRTMLVAFAGVSLLCAAAPTIETLVAGRALLGVAAAGMVPASVAILASLYADKGARMRAIGSWAAVSSSGLLAGPLLGGLLLSVGDWRLIFLVNPPIAVLSLVLVRGMANRPAARARPLDRPGIVLSIMALACLTFGMIDGGTNGWWRVVPVTAVCAGVLLVIALVGAERRSTHPVLPPGLLARRPVRDDMIAAAVATLIFYGVLFTLTLWYQRDRGLSPLETGLAFVPMTLPMCVLPMITGRMIQRLGARPIILFGLGADVFAGLLLAGSGQDGALGWIIVAEVALVLASTTAIPAAMAHMAATAPPEYAASAQGALNAGRQAGAALGVALLGPLTSLPMAGGVLAAVAAVALLNAVWPAAVAVEPASTRG